MNKEQLAREIRRIRAHVTLLARRIRAAAVKRAPKAKELWGKYGYYAAAAALVTVIAVGAYAYRGREESVGVEREDAAPVSISVASAHEEPETPAFSLPMSGRITGTYSVEIPVWSESLDAWQVHTGVDIASDADASVSAMADGVVSEVYEDALMGWIVEIEHDGGYMTRYASLDSVLVTPGDAVRRGRAIGQAGDSAVGEPGQGKHLHLEAYLSGERIDPMSLINPE